MVNVKSVNFSIDGTVSIELSDKKKFKINSQYWIDLSHPRDGNISESLIEELEHESNYTKIREKILSLLSSREHSVLELKRKIKQSLLKSRIKNFTSLFNRCIKEMQDKDFQSDERFARVFVKSRIANKLQGPFMILQDLQNRGISSELAKTILEEISDQKLWIQKSIDCLEYFNKKNNNLSDESFSQKLFQRGFPWDIIHQAIEIYKFRQKN